MGNVEKIQTHNGQAGEFLCDVENARSELIADLSRTQAQISPKYFYNALGSKLFEAICQLDEYYLTRTEAAIFDQFLPEIAEVCGQHVTLIDLGAGNCAKAARLFDALSPQQYVPIDISIEFLWQAVTKLQLEHPHIPMRPIGIDFTTGLTLPLQIRQDRRLFFYPGSSLGNFTPLQAVKFLKRIRKLCQNTKDCEDAILIGIDLVKDSRTLEAAYDDPLGVTAAFNLNALRHVNQILNSDFDVASWRHRAIFNQEQSRIEMHLEARHGLTVHWIGGSRAFRQGERIHTENSYKYTPDGFIEILAQAGFADASCWSNPSRAFLVCHAKAI